MEILTEEIEAAARVKSLASAPGERREFGYIELNGGYHVMQSRYIRTHYGIEPKGRYRNSGAARQPLTRAAL